MTTLMGGRPRYDLMFPQADHVDVDKLVTALLVKDSFEGHHIAGTPDTYKHGWVKIGVGVDSSHLSLKKNGDVVHKPTGTVIGHVDKKTDFPTKGTSTFVTSHANGKQVYGGVYKKDAMAAVARYHNHAAATETQTQELASNLQVPGPMTLPAAEPGSMSHDEAISKLQNVSFDGGDYASLNAGKQRDIAVNALKKGDAKTASFALSEASVSLSNGLSKTTTAAQKLPLIKQKNALNDVRRGIDPEYRKSFLTDLNVHPGEAVGSVQVHDAINHPQLSVTQKAAVKAYSKNAYELVNASLAKGTPSNVAQNVVDAVNSSTVTSPLVVRRLIKGNVADQVFGDAGSKIGKTFNDKRLASSTSEKMDGLGFGNVELQYHLTPGAKALDLNHHGVSDHPSENEILIGSNQNFTVLSDKVNPDGKRIISVQAVPHGTVPPKVEPSVGVESKPDLIPGSNVPKALTGQPAYEHAQASQGSLNPTQLNAVASYGKPSGYKVVNPYLNKDGMVFDSGSMKYKPASENQVKTAKTMIKHLDAAIVAGKPTTQDLVVHRRLGNSINDLIGPPGSHVGKTFVNKAYVSTTTADAGIPGNGYGYENKKTLMDIQVPKGSKVLMGQAAEKEVILPRGAKFTVVDDQVEADGTRHVKVLYHPDQIEPSDLPKPVTLEKPEVKPTGNPVVPVPGVANKPEGTMSLKKNGETKGYYHLENHTVFDANGTSIGTSTSKLGALHLASGDEAKANELGAHYTPATPSVPIPEASSASHEDLAKQLSDQAVGMEDNLSSSMHLPLAVQSTLSSAAAMSGGKKSTALTHLALASEHLNNHAKAVPDDAVLAASYQHSLDQIENKIKGSDSSSGDIDASNTIKDVAGKIDTELTDSTHTSHAYDSTFDAWSALKQGDLQGAVGHLNAAQVHLTHHVNAHSTDFVKGMGLYQKLENVKSSLQGAVAPNIPASAKPSIPAEPVHVPSGPMIDSTDLSMKISGDVVHKQTKQVIGHVVKYKDVPSKGTTTFVVSHNDGTKVYQGPYKGKALAALAQHHNTKGTGGAPASEVSTATQPATFGPPPGADPVLDKNGTGDIIGYHHPGTKQVTDLQGHVVGHAEYKKTAAQQLLNAQNPKVQKPKTKPVVNEGYHGNIKLNPGEKSGTAGVRASIDHPVLSAPELSAARMYSGSDYRDMNRYVAAGYTFGDSFTYHTADDKKVIKDAVDALKPAIDRSVAKEPFAVVRRVPGYAATDTFGSIGSHIGKTYKENRFVSTTSSTKGISSFGETEIHYHIKPGTKALDMNQHNASLHKNEKEILLGPGQTFKILSDGMVGKNRIIVVESQ